LVNQRRIDNTKKINIINGDSIAFGKDTEIFNFINFIKPIPRHQGTPLPDPLASDRPDRVRTPGTMHAGGKENSGLGFSKYKTLGHGGMEISGLSKRENIDSSYLRLAHMKTTDFVGERVRTSDVLAENSNYDKGSGRVNLKGSDIFLAGDKGLIHN
jgi:hypothetical protein